MVIDDLGPLPLHPYTGTTPTGAMSFAKVIYMPEENILSVMDLAKQSQLSAQQFETLRVRS